jgi:ribonuclease HII
MYIVGIDEVGRGPIAGPLLVCACAIREGVDVLPLFPKNKLRDSKKLSEKVRIAIVEKLGDFTLKKDIVFGLGEISAKDIDDLGLTQAIQKAVELALCSIHHQGVPQDSFIFLDGSLHAKEEYQQETIIRGDEKVTSIALASIFAKVTRDSYMREVAKEYPLYGFENHVGYGTRAHYEAISTHGLSIFHRKSFLKKIL